MKSFHKVVVGFGVLTLIATTSAQIYQNRYRVQSRDNRYSSVHVRMVRGDRVRLTRQLSDSPCIEGRTWGVRGDSIWVDRGCRADFEIYSPGRDRDRHDWDRDRGRDYDRKEVRTIVVVDRGDRYVANIHRIRVSKWDSREPCIEGRTWGRKGDRIWVKPGIRAEFEVWTR